MIMLIAGIGLTIAVTLSVAFIFTMILFPNLYGQILTIITLIGWALFAILKIVQGLRNSRDGLMTGKGQVAFGLGILVTFATLLAI
jgi:hypothetical protein